MAPGILEDLVGSPLGQNGVSKETKILEANNSPSKLPLNNKAPSSNGNGATTNIPTTSVKASTYPGSGISLVNRFIDEPRSLRVSVIGGGLAGILAGILLPKKVPGIQLRIYEKNKDFVSVASWT